VLDGITPTAGVQVFKEKLGKTVGNQYITALFVMDLKKQQKDYVVVFARQHPCETQGSWVC
jgi:hypothetical protein